MKDLKNVKKIKIYRYLFGSAGFFNLLSVVMFLVNYKMYFQSYGYNLAYGPVWTTLYLGFIALFGIGYILVAIDPVRHFSIAILGVIGKIFVFTTFLVFTILGVVAPGVTGVAIIDVIFAVLFIRYLFEVGKIER
jgi:hypothetical protein